MNRAILKTGISIILCLVSLNPVLAQSENENANIVTVQPNEKPTIFRQAGDYSAEHDVLTIAILRGTYEKELYDKYIVHVGQKLDSLDIPYRFFQEFHGKPGTNLTYFIENDLNGPMNGNEFYALIPHIERLFKAQYPNREN